MIVFSEIKRCQLPYSTQFFQKAKIGSISLSSLAASFWLLPPSRASRSENLLAQPGPENTLAYSFTSLRRIGDIACIFGAIQCSVDLVK